LDPDPLVREIRIRYQNVTDPQNWSNVKVFFTVFNRVNNLLTFLVPKPKKGKRPRVRSFCENVLILVISSTFMRKVFRFYVKANYM
jgi:hypothetical protein